MFLGFFKRWSKKERFIRRAEKLFSKLVKEWNYDLISKLEEEKDQGKIYFAIREVMRYHLLGGTPELHEESEQTMREVGLSRWIELFKDINRDEPKIAFILLTESHARLLTREEFRRFFAELSELPPDLMDRFLFEREDLNLQFKEAAR